MRDIKTQMICPGNMLLDSQNSVNKVRSVSAERYTFSLFDSLKISDVRPISIQHFRDMSENFGLQKGKVGRLSSFYEMPAPFTLRIAPKYNGIFEVEITKMHNPHASLFKGDLTSVHQIQNAFKLVTEYDLSFKS